MRQGAPMVGLEFRRLKISVQRFQIGDHANFLRACLFPSEGVHPKFCCLGLLRCEICQHPQFPVFLYGLKQGWVYGSFLVGGSNRDAKMNTFCDRSQQSFRGSQLYPVVEEVSGALAGGDEL